jgi:type I restriction enzyme R subunit
LYQLRDTLESFQIFYKNEIENFASIFFQTISQTNEDLGKLSIALRPAIDRFNVKTQEDKDLFSATLARFLRIYDFVTQVWRMFDRDLYKLAAYAKLLLKLLPKNTDERVKLDDKISLEYYVLKKEFEGSIELKGIDGGFAPIKGEAGAKKEKLDPLSIIIKNINEKFGTNFTGMDKVLEQISQDFQADEHYREYAKNNTEEAFGLVFEQGFRDKTANRYNQNNAFFIKMFEDESFMKFALEQLKPEIYNRLKNLL